MQLVLELGRRPGGDTAEVPLVQERPGLVDRQVEALDENASGVERSIVTALAGDGRRDLGQVGRRPGQPLVMRLADADTAEAAKVS